MDMGALEAESHISSTHRSHIRDQKLEEEQRDRRCMDAPADTKTGFSCHKPPHGIRVRLSCDGNQC